LKKRLKYPNILLLVINIDLLKSYAESSIAFFESLSTLIRDQKVIIILEGIQKIELSDSLSLTLRTFVKKEKTILFLLKTYSD